MSISTARLEPDNPMPGRTSSGARGPDFNNRLVQEINNESSAIKFVIYRLTVDNITKALSSKFQSGVPMQLIVEPTEYLNRKWPEFWLTHANIDKLWAAGVPIKQRQHDGAHAHEDAGDVSLRHQRLVELRRELAAGPGLLRVRVGQADDLPGDG